MIYSKQENPKCTLCVFAQPHSTEGNVTCEYKGTVPSDFCCKKFKYDIFKKTIRKRKSFTPGGLSQKDFSL